MTAQKWDFDTVHSSVNFSVRHLMVSKVRGHFEKWKGSLAIDEADLTKSTFDAEIEVGSVDTKDEKRDGHLKSPDFFDAEKFPTITFKSKSIARVDATNYKVTGDLTIHGVTQTVELAVEDSGRVKDPWGGDRAGFTAHTTISREAFGVKYNAALEAGGVVIGDKVEINLEIEAVKAKA